MSLVKAKGPIPKKLAHKRRVVKNAPVPRKPLPKVKPGKKPYKWKRKPTPKDEKAFITAAHATRQCALTKKWGKECRPPLTFQHPQGLRYRGTSRKGDAKLGFMLCWGHHQEGPNSIREMGIKAWEKKYGPQEQHAAGCRKRIKDNG